MLSGKLFIEIKSNPSFTPSDLDTVSDLVYEFLSKPNVTIDLTRTSWFRPLHRRFADVKPAELKVQVG